MLGYVPPGYELSDPGTLLDCLSDDTDRLRVEACLYSLVHCHHLISEVTSMHMDAVVTCKIVSLLIHLKIDSVSGMIIFYQVKIIEKIFSVTIEIRTHDLRHQSPST